MSLGPLSLSLVVASFGRWFWWGGGSVVCADWSEEGCSMYPEGRGHWKCGSVQSFSGDMGTKGDREAEAMGLAMKEEERQG